MTKRSSPGKTRCASTFSIVQEAEGASANRSEALTQITGDEALKEQVAGELAAQNEQRDVPKRRRDARMTQG